MKDRILKLLINGLKASEIANIVGCSAAYIAQLCKDEEFVKAIENGRIEAAAKHTEEEHLDNRYEGLEHKMLSAADAALAEASFSEIMNGLEKINKRKDQLHARKNPAAPAQTALTVNVVSLQLPAHALPSNAQPTITLNEKQEIIAIGGQALAPMSSEAVKNLFAARSGKPSDAQLIAEM